MKAWPRRSRSQTRLSGPAAVGARRSSGDRGDSRGADNPNIGWLAAVIPLGTPVLVER
jgi:hypothetical protein